MFTTLDKIAHSDPKTADIVLIENYAAFQNRLCFFLVLFINLLNLFCMRSFLFVCLAPHHFVDIQVTKLLCVCWMQSL
jgi:hypothetical protein